MQDDTACTVMSFIAHTSTGLPHSSRILRRVRVHPLRAQTKSFTFPSKLWWTIIALRRRDEEYLRGNPRPPSSPFQAEITMVSRGNPTTSNSRFRQVVTTLTSAWLIMRPNRAARPEGEKDSSFLQGINRRTVQRQKKFLSTTRNNLKLHAK